MSQADAAHQTQSANGDARTKAEKRNDNKLAEHPSEDVNSRVVPRFIDFRMDVNLQW
jgi:hypothetical protein